LCPWARHLMGCLYVCVVKHVVTGVRLTRRPEKGHFPANCSAEKKLVGGRGNGKSNGK